MQIKKQCNSDGNYLCSKCNEWFPKEKFSKNKQQSSGLNYACKSCMKKHTRKYNLPSKYNITIEQYEQKLINQQGRCACCGIVFDTEIPSKRACVDHNHSTMEVRDLLCGRCNLAAGNVLDSAKYAMQLAQYLLKWNCK